MIKQIFVGFLGILFGILGIIMTLLLLMSHRMDSFSALMGITIVLLAEASYHVLSELPMKKCIDFSCERLISKNAIKCPFCNTIQE